MTTISLGAKKFGTDLGMKAPAKRSTKHKIIAPTFPKGMNAVNICLEKQ